MTLRRKTLIVVGVTTASLILVLYVVSRAIVLGSFTELEEYLVVSLLVIGLVFSGAALLLVDRMVLARLARLSAEVGGIGGSGDVSARVLAAGEDELAGLGGAINEMLAALERSQRALQEGEERYRLLFNSGNDIVLVSALTDAGSPGKLIEANDVARQKLGYTREELLQLSLLDVAVPESETDLPSLWEGLATENRVLFEAIGVAKDGARIPVAVSAHLFNFGAEPAVLSIASDVSERRQTERELVASEKRFRSIAETASDAVIILDSQENILFWNQAAKDIFGYWAGETQGKFLDAIMPEWSSQVFRTLVSEVVSTGSSDLIGKTIEAFGIRKDGGEFPLELSVAAWHAGEEVLFTVIARDITERKQGEEALRASEQRLRDVARTTGDWIWEADAEGRYTYVSSVVEQVLGYRPDEVLGRRYYSFFHPRDREPLKALIQEAWRRKEPLKVVSPHVHKDGRVVVLETTGLPLTDAEGKLLGYRGAHRDVTAERQLEERLAAVYALGRELVLSRDVRQIAQATVEAAKLLFHCQMCELWLADEERRVLVRLASKAVEPVAHILTLPLDGGQGITVTVARSGEPLYAPDVRQEPLYVDAGIGTRSELCVPLRAGERVIGVLNAESEKVDAFAGGGQQLLSTLADQAALAIENAHLYEAVTQQREELRALARRLAEAEESERQRLARDLHDQVGQNLTALGINLNILRTQIPEQAMSSLRSRLDDSLELVERTTEQIRGVMADLRPPVLDDYGLMAALRWYGAQFASRGGITVTVQGDELTQRLTVPVENALFRIAQEALTNVTRHAQATQATVAVEVDDETIRLIVTDDGVGFDPDSVTGPDGRRGWGLLTMAERAEALGGHFRIESRPGQGTRVIVEVAR